MNEKVYETERALRVYGEMTIYRAGELARDLLEAIRQRSDTVHLDLSEVTEFDTAGLQLLLMARRIAAANGGQLDIVQSSECVRESLELCNLTEMLAAREATAP